TPFYFAGFSKMKAMSTNNDYPMQASQPFNMDRDGFVMSEGAGVLLLEEYEHTQQRGAEILGEIIGYGSTTDAYHITDPTRHGAQKEMQLAIVRANIQPEDVDYINAHGKSTPRGDVCETIAIKDTLGNYDNKLTVCSTK